LTKTTIDNEMVATPRARPTRLSGVTGLGTFSYNNLVVSASVSVPLTPCNN
jgi:hypothetical protein